ncbi:hypothetical protein [Methanosarcina sp. UBA289]|uniref:hypothetical protein n=1 Tax=Methanosarcina sp. UBA289 TaxID=1915574 RepID=UPI0025CC6D88|nr:hypothetical protein [Methanosarcina sp. UBA289]
MGSNKKPLEKRQQFFKTRYEQKVQLLEKELEKRERLIQTYLIVFGLYLAYDKSPSLQVTAMRQFLGFIFFALMYYTGLTKYTYYMKSRPEKLLFYLINVSSFFCSLIFSCTLIDYIYQIGTNGLGLPLPKTFVVFALICITWLPLYLSSDLQIQFPETLLIEESRIIYNNYISNAKKIFNFLLYLILILIFSTIAYIILLVALNIIGESSNLSLFKLIMLLFAFFLNSVLLSKIISIRSNWPGLTFSISDNDLTFFKYDHIVFWRKIFKKGFPYILLCTFLIVFFINTSSTMIYTAYMQYQSQFFTNQQKAIIFILYAMIGSALHFEILFSLSPQVVNILRTEHWID